MKLNVTEILLGFSTALDAVEGELIGATTYHGQRVAYISSLMGRSLGLTDRERLYLAIAAALHDNALTQYAQGELMKGRAKDDITIERNPGVHCTMGEENVSVLPLYPYIKNAIMYHHEQADGNGPFKKLPEEIPLFARIIHLADRVDVGLDFSHIDEAKFERAVSAVRKGIGTHYDTEVADAFLTGVTFRHLKGIEGGKIVGALYQELPTLEREYNTDELVHLSDMFARIIDFKSPFTTRHSHGIAEKARIMGQYYNWDDVTCNMLYFTGAVHDVGKLFVDNALLEKPGKLTEAEFDKIKDHASGTYVVLKGIDGLGEIVDWAALHHEKLDGTGYPFGKTGDELGQKERLMACIDIYQALVESRPYKDGMPHDKAMNILKDLADKGKIDKDIVNDIDIRFKDWVEPAC